MKYPTHLHKDALLRNSPVGRVVRHDGVVRKRGRFPVETKFGDRVWVSYTSLGDDVWVWTGYRFVHPDDYTTQARRDHRRAARPGYRVNPETGEWYQLTH